MEVLRESYFWKILESNFPSTVKSSVKGLRLSKDSKGVVFDVPSDLCSVIQVKFSPFYVLRDVMLSKYFLDCPPTLGISPPMSLLVGD